MGYSVPKTPFNMKDFLNEPAPQNVRRRYGYRAQPFQPRPDQTIDSIADSDQDQKSPSGES